jgi:protocatechuate 3,4-dioxygenase, alpha subunit
MSGETTPSQTVGPYFSIGFDWLNRSDLTRGASGSERVTIRGRILDGEGQPVPDACLELWQADISGKYAQAENAKGKSPDQEFCGFGRIPTNEHGEFSFTTIKPGSVPGLDGRSQAPHIQITVFMRGLLRRLVTRLYFSDDAAHATDHVLNLVPAARRATLIARPNAEEPHTFEWNIHLQGEHETVFFDC